MADANHETGAGRAGSEVTVTSVAWANVLDFVHLFKGFRLASNPAKMVVGLLAILAVYCSGRVFDLAWGPQVYRGEIEAYQQSKPEVYRARREEMLEARRSQLHVLLELTSTGSGINLSSAEIDRLSESPRAAYRQIRRQGEAKFHEEVRKAAEERQQEEQAQTQFADRWGPVMGSPAERERAARQRQAQQLMDRMTTARETTGYGIFDALLRYELKQFDTLVANTLTFVRIAPVRRTGEIGSEPTEETAVSGGLVSKNPDRFWQSDTVVGSLANMTLTGPSWLFTATAPMQWHSATPGFAGWIKTVAYRGMYLASLVLLAVFWMAVVALSGGIICRLSALEFAGETQPSLKQAIAFAVRKFGVFFKAPLMPFAMLLAVGLLMAGTGLIGAIPFVGELLLGVFFILFLVGGFVLTLLVLGIIGGFNLLYPTVAVEGSDSFDAMSRSFAYVYARPWRMGIYTIISLIYGVLTFLFVAFAVYLLLALTHVFAGWGTSVFGYNSGWYSGAPKLDTLWPMPQVNRLAPPTNWWAMSWTEWFGAVGLHFWVFLVLGMLGAYVISFYHSSNVIIYYLLRRVVDGQSLTEVYGETEGSESADASPSEATAATPAEATHAEPGTPSGSEVPLAPPPGASVIPPSPPAGPDANPAPGKPAEPQD